MSGGSHQATTLVPHFPSHAFEVVWAGGKSRETFSCFQIQHQRELPLTHYGWSHTWPTTHM